MDDYEFNYIGESADQEEINVDQEDDLNEDFEPRSTRVNAEGKRIRGTDLVWTKKVNFNTPEAFLESNILDEIKETYTSKRKREHETHEVHNYVCHFSQRQKFLPCKKQLRIVFPSDSKEVFVQETGVHEHIENPDFVETSHVFKWSKKATEILVTGIKMNSRPKVMLRELRDINCFDGQTEPSQIQIYNKIAHLKKIMNLSENLLTTFQLRQKVQEHTDIPDNDIQGFVPHYIIEDDADNEGDARFVIVYSTKRLLEAITKSDTAHWDATYRLVWQGYPVIIGGVSSETNFFGTMVVLTSHEDTNAWKHIFNYVHSVLNIHPRYLMADGAQSITKACYEVFATCEKCQNILRLMCWSHTHRAILPQIKRIKSKEIEKSLLKDIEEIQWSANMFTFDKMIDLVEEKYVKSKAIDHTVIKSLEDFFSYFRSTWVHSKEKYWFEGAHPFGSSNNQGIEGQNRDIKASFTFRKKMPLGSFSDCVLKMVHEWSLSTKYSTIGVDRKQKLWNNPDSLKLRSNGYNWFMDHKSNSNYAEIKIAGKQIKTLKENVSSIWAIPSSKTKKLDSTLKELGKERLATRFEIPSNTSFDKVMEVRNSCHLVEQSGQDFFCDCFEGIRGRLCKHSVGLLYKTGTIEVDHDVRSKPLGAKRKRGRPKKLPSCLTRSPEPVKSGNVPVASYHQPSPDVSLIEMPVPVSPIRQSPTSPASIILNLSLSRKRSRELSPAPEPLADVDSLAESPSPITIPTPLLPPPAKRISRRKKLKLTFDGIEENIVDIKIKKASRSSKRLKNKS